MLNHILIRTGAAAALLAAIGAAHADGNLSVSGFGSIVGGQTFGSCVAPDGMAPAYANTCTRNVVDWSHDGVYTNDFSLGQETRLGLQLTDSFARDWSGTVQLTARPQRDEHLNLEWAYLTYKPAPGFTLQVGRKRLPLYYYSDFQDIGYAYNAIRPSPDVYGWDIVNYDGASLGYESTLGGWNLHAEMQLGGERTKDNAYQRLVAADNQNIDWPDMAGLTLEFSNDELTGRLSYLHSNFEQSDQFAGPVQLFNGTYESGQRFLGMALNADLGNWVLRSEGGFADRANAMGYRSHFYYLSAGYHLGRFTPTLGYSAYRESTPYPGLYAPVHDTTTSATLRYEVSKNADVKLQLDIARDPGTGGVPTFAGSSRVLSASYDFVF